MIGRWMRRLARRLADRGWLHEMRRHEVLSRRQANRLESAYLHGRLSPKDTTDA